MSFIGLDTQPQASSHTPIQQAQPIQPQLEPLIRNLERALRVDQERYWEFEAYYNGDHPHSFDSARFQQAFGKQLRRFCDNWLRMVVKVTADRLVVQGFRVGDGSDASVDDLAWRAWQANKLDAQSPMAHREAMKFGTCFLLVDPFDHNGNRLPAGKPPRISVESPMQMVGQRDAIDRYRMLNAVKKWVDDDGYLRLNLFLPDVVYKYRSSAPAAGVTPGDQNRLTQEVSWEQLGEAENPLGVVPVVPMENCPDLIMGGHSDLEDLIPLNDGLNKVLRDMLITSEYQAFQQRVIIGAEIPKDPETGRPMTEQQIQLMASRSRAWLFPNPNTKVESLPQIDLTPFTNAVDLFIHHISMLSQTPAYMLVGKMANMSADSLRAAEMGFIGKLTTKQTDFGVAWEQAIQIALLCMGETVEDEPIETIWQSAVANSGSDLSNELVQLSALSIPQEVLWMRAGASPQDVERWKALNKENAPKPVEPPTLVPTGHELGVSGVPPVVSSAASVPSATDQNNNLK